MSSVASLSAGLVFGIGLIVSGLTNPANIIGFLDLRGSWDPSLAFAMAAAVGVSVLGFAVAKHRTRAYLGGVMQLPSARAIDRRLVLGGLVFGVGWGIAGLCPGPALVALGTGNPQAVLFVAAMLAGMALFNGLERHRLAFTSLQAVARRYGS